MRLLNSKTKSKFKNKSHLYAVNSAFKAIFDIKKLLYFKNRNF